MDQSNTTLSEQVEQDEHRTTRKDPTTLETVPVDQSLETPRHQKKTTMKK